MHPLPTSSALCMCRPLDSNSDNMLTWNVVVLYSLYAACFAPAVTYLFALVPVLPFTPSSILSITPPISLLITIRLFS